jgi:hypothetical protein
MAVVGDIFLFSFTLLDTGILMFLLVFFIITLSDLECDYLNAQECCSRLNFWNVPKLWVQLIIPVLLLVMGHWILVLINLPMCVWLIRKFYYIPSGNLGEYDPAEIHNAGQLRKHMVDVCIHLGWQMVGFFLYLYCLLDAVMQEPVLIQMDNDVTVLNKPAATGYYETLPPHSHGDHEPAGHKDYDF